MANAPAPADLWAYEPPISLWSLVEKHVHPHEREEVKNMLGASLVEQSLELHDEVSHLYFFQIGNYFSTKEHLTYRPLFVPYFIATSYRTEMFPFNVNRSICCWKSGENIGRKLWSKRRIDLNLFQSPLQPERGSSKKFAFL